MEKALVSVIITTYRRPALLCRAIESVLRQSYQGIEIIVVDDASEDTTEERVREIEDERIKYICHAKNMGLAAVGRNTGLKEAKGEFVAFLDDDDEWREDKLERQLRLMGRYDAVFSSALVNRKYEKRYGYADVSVSALRRGNQFCPSSLLARTAIMREVGFDENLRQGEDWDAYIRMIRKHRLGYVNETLLYLNDGAHQRITNEAKDLSKAELEKRMAVVYKNRDFFGKYYSRRHIASVILSYIGSRSGVAAQLVYAVRRCGVVPVVDVLAWKIARRTRRIVERIFSSDLVKSS